MLSRKLVVVGLLLTASLGTALVGCGDGASVVVPDQQPLPVPDALGASVDAEGVVTLHWQASASANVVGYNIYKFSASPASESAFLKLNAAPVAGNSLAEDVFQGGGDFRVRSVAGNGRESASSAFLHLDPYSPADVNKKHPR